MAAPSKAEYLKKYLSENAEKKKKKKRKIPSSSAKISKSRIVDDDVDFKSLLPDNLANTLDEDVGDNEPVVAEFIDERPEHVKQLERFRDSGAWKLMGDIEDTKTDSSPTSRTRHDSGSDHSPPRKKRHDSDSEQSPPRRKRHDSDQSPPRRKHHDSDQSPPRRKRHDSDQSPPRRKHDSDQPPPRRKHHDSDQSPPRRRKRHDSDQSPPRRKQHDSDQSPPRKKRLDQSPPRTHSGGNLKSENKINPASTKSNKERKKSRFSDIEPSDKFSYSDKRIDKKGKRHDSDSDQSPPRRKRHDSDSDQSPPRRKRHDSDSDQSPPRRKRRDSDSAQSPPRRNKPNSDSDQSPPRKRKNNAESDQTPPRRRRYNSDSDQSPPRRKSSNSYNRSKPPVGRRHDSDSDLSPPLRSQTKSASHDKEQKTLAGKKAGLSSAKDMRREAQELRRKEEEKFDQISDEHLGKGAATVFRDRKSGKKRDLEEERRQQSEENSRKAKENEKYQKWGKGMKQAEQQNRKVEDALHEVNKPLARYKDDEDLDKMLREMDRAEDPMLAFIKKKKKGTDEPKNEKPRYKGPLPPPNRFGIYPGYRWDGVDRSNGFEKKLFSMQSESRAKASQAYKWSVEDM